MPPVFTLTNITLVYFYNISLYMFLSNVSMFCLYLIWLYVVP